MISDKFIKVTSGRIVDENTVALTSFDGNLDYGIQHAEINVWSSDKTQPLFVSTVVEAFVEQFIRYKSGQYAFDGLCVLSSPADDSKVVFFQKGDVHTETIKGLMDEPVAACMHALTEIDGVLYSCGGDGTVFRREGKDKWAAVDNGVRAEMSAFDASMIGMEFVKTRKKLGQTEPSPMGEWLEYEKFKYTDGRKLFAINGTGHNNIYACGSYNTPKGKAGMVYHYNGTTWRRLNTPETRTLCSIYIDDAGTVLIGGYDGHLLESKDGIHFKDVSGPADLMVINEFSRYQETLYLGTSDGLFQYKNGVLSLPDIRDALERTVDDGFLEEALNIDIQGEYLLLVGLYSAYRYHFPTQKCELIIKFTGRMEEEKFDEDE